MLKNASLALILTLICFASIHAQPTTVLKANPLSLLLATINVQAERALNERFSAQLGVLYGGNTIPRRASDITNDRFRVFAVTPELRYHANFKQRDCPAGIFFAPFLRFRSVAQGYEGPVSDPDSLVTRANVEVRRNNFGGGVLIGYEFILGDHLALDLYIGPQFLMGKRQVTVDCTTCDGNEFAPPTGLDAAGLELRAGISLGYAF